VLVVGAGQVATEATVTAAHLGAAVTVCNRTARHAAKLAASGATWSTSAHLSTCWP
jgi:glutamyl-tRNA reductase